MGARTVQESRNRVLCVVLVICQQLYSCSLSICPRTILSCGAGRRWRSSPTTSAPTRWGWGPAAGQWRPQPHASSAFLQCSGQLDVQPTCPPLPVCHASPLSQLMGSALYALGDFEGAKAALKQSLR